MNKLKLLLPILMAALMALTIPFAAACKKKNEDSDDDDNNIIGPDDKNPDDGSGNDTETITLQSISVNADNAKTTYIVGESFDPTGIVVVASTLSSKTNETSNITLTESQYTVDSQAFDNTTGGQYTISVSYTLDSVTKDASYSVYVYQYDGLEVTLDENTPNTYELTVENNKAEIDVSKIVVKEINNLDGSVGDAITDYSVALFSGTTEIEVTDNIATVNEGGTYQIWAYKNSEILEGYVLQGFVNIYVSDTVVGLEFLSGSTEQAQDEDAISSTWKFKATYASGSEKTLTASDVLITGLDTKTVTENGVAEVTYTEVNAQGVETTVSTTVNYTITPAAAGTTISESFVVIRDLESGASYEANSDIVSNSLFSISADSDLAYTATTSNNLSITLLGENTVTPLTAGLTSSTNVSGDEHSTEFTFVAKENITLYVYLTSSNSSYNSNKKAILYAAINGEELSSVSLGNRNVYVELKYSLKAGDTLTMYGVMDGAGVQGRLWLFGAEAVGKVGEDVDDDTTIPSTLEFDFTDTEAFKPVTIAGNDVSSPVPVTDINDKEIGISLTKSSSSGKYNQITTTSDGTQVLQLQGSAKITQNTIVITVGAGTTEITVKYFQAAGRYLDLLDSSGTVLQNSSSASTTESSITAAQEYTFTVTSTEETTLYLGSHSSGMYISYLKINTVANEDNVDNGLDVE